MKVEEIREIARRHGIVPGRMRKVELIRAIQAREGNFPCYETGQAESCGQDGCLWRSDCS